MEVKGFGIDELIAERYEHHTNVHLDAMMETMMFCCMNKGLGRHHMLLFWLTRYVWWSIECEYFDIIKGEMEERLYGDDQDLPSGSYTIPKDNEEIEAILPFGDVIADMTGSQAATEFASVMKEIGADEYGENWELHELDDGHEGCIVHYPKLIWAHYRGLK